MSSTTPPPRDPGGPEFLDAHDGEPAGPADDDGGNRRRTALVAGGAAVGLALVGTGAWAAMSFFATGAQPAEALPASTVGYASVDLDPSGGQKVEAFRMIEKFPALKKELGGFDADDDLLEKIFGTLEEECDGLSYADDVKPWLGHRFGVAAVDLGEEMPTPVGVLQVTDADAAEDGLATLQDCGGDVGGGGWAIVGEWAVVAESDDLAREVVDQTGEGTLAEDASYREWTDEVGDAGVMSFYAAPEAGRFLADVLASPINPIGGPMGLFDGGLPPLEEDPGTDPDAPASPALPEEVERALDEFEGMAAALRFEDGALEFEVAGSPAGVAMQDFVGEAASESVGSLPEDTAAVLGISLPEGWLQKALEQAASLSGGEMTAEQMLSELEAQTGLTADDVETLVGESTALAVGSDLDPEVLFGSSDGSGVPVGAKIKGDADGIQRVLAKLAEQGGGGELGFLAHDAEGGFVAVGPDGDYRKALLGDGGLGDSEVFRNVVREADGAGTILYVNFDAGDWLANLAGSDPVAKDNLEPLQGIGFSSWVEGGSSHAVFRLTTN